MIISRTPFRVTLGGGGTDLPSYYSRYGGFIFAVALNKYMFINVNRPIVDDFVRVKYSKSEIVNHRDELQHEIAREALRMLDIERGVEIISMADVPAGTGLGSSSCYAVGLLNALHTLKREPVALHQLAEEACHLEIEVLGKPIGKQDQYMATFGGFTILEINTEGVVTVTRAPVSQSVADDLERNMLLFYTGSSRLSLDILREQSKGAAQEKTAVVESLHRIKEMGYEIKEAIVTGNLTDFGLALDRHWQLKKRMSDKISSPTFDCLYELAKANGALGGKISGAGGGGFLTLYAESCREKLRKAMLDAGLREMRYRFEFEGSKILVNLMDGSFLASTSANGRAGRGQRAAA
jgi:D-glycero-alpha-D-manno-heptose-7-phosphate kinase